MIKSFFILFFAFIALVLPDPVLGQSVVTSFSPAAVTAPVNSDFTIKVIVTPDQNITVAGYTIKVGFDTSRLNLKNISYLVGSRSENLNGDDNDDITEINSGRSAPQINLVGESLSSSGYPVNAGVNKPFVELTFTVVAAQQTNIQTYSGSNLTIIKSNSELESLPLSLATLIVNQTVSPPPTSPPPATPPPQITGVDGLPGCISDPLSDTQKQAASLSWTSSSSGPFWVDISPNANFNPYYHKGPVASPTDLDGLNKYNVSPAQEIVILPGTNYYIRVYDESTSQHSSSHLLNIPACVTPPPTSTTTISGKFKDPSGNTLNIDAFIPKGELGDNPGTCGGLSDINVRDGSFSLPNVAYGTRFCLRAPQVPGYAGPKTNFSVDPTSGAAYECQWAGEEHQNTGQCKDATDLLADSDYNFTYTLVTPLSCSAFSPNGLTESGQGEGGIKIYTTQDYDGGGRRLLNVTRSPADATINKPTSAPDLTFESAADGSGNWYVSIPDNNSTAADNDYTVSATVSSGGVSANCTSFIIHVPKKPVDTACPADINSTQARMRASDQDSWTRNLSMTSGNTIFVAGFHNNQTDTEADDIILTSTGPEGDQSHVVTLNDNNNNVSYAPTLVGKYTITATKNGKTGPKCTGDASLTVNAATVTTTSYRIAESLADLDDPDKAPWRDYAVEPVKIDFEFTDKTPGQKFVWVEFKDSTGYTKRHNAQIELLGPDPVITSCSLGFEGINTVLNLTGQNFGSDKGTVKSGDTALQVREWKNTSIRAVWQNAPEGQVLPVTVTNPDGQIGEGQCSAISLLSLGAKVFCRMPSSHDTDNVALTLAGAYEGGTKVKQKVKIDKDGIIQGLTQRLENGKNYKLSLKAPKSLRKTVEFTAGDGATNISDFMLPVGDIFPADGGDGTVNSLDKGELNRQWIIAGDVTSRSGDFNRDSRVNSIDWACMRYDFGRSDDAEAVPGGPPATPTPSYWPSPSVSLSPSPSSSSSPSVSPSATPVAGSSSLGMYVKFQDIISNGPDKFVSLSLRQPGTNTELWKFDSVRATTNNIPYLVNTNRDIYWIGIGNVQYGTYDVYLNSSGYQEKKFPNILVDSNPLNDPETYVLNGSIVSVP